MADTFEGTLKVRKTTTSQFSKEVSLNTADFKAAESMTGRMTVDLEGLSGTRTLTENESRRKILDALNTKAGGLTIEIDNDIKQAYWLRDLTDDGADVIYKSVGGSDDLVIPRARWTLVRTRAATMEQMAGWQDASLAPALVFGTSYLATSGRALKIYKTGADPADAGGRITLEGSVERTIVPVVGDTMVTLPAGYRPAHTIAFAVLAEPASATNVDVVVVEITTVGLVILRSLLLWTTAINVPIDLSGISFFAAN